MHVFWLDPLTGASAQGDVDLPGLTFANCALSLTSTYVVDAGTHDTYWSGQAAPLRLHQRNDGLDKISASPRLQQAGQPPTSQQLTKSRILGREGQSYL